MHPSYYFGEPPHQFLSIRRRDVANVHILIKIITAAKKCADKALLPAMRFGSPPPPRSPTASSVNVAGLLLARCCC